MRFHRISAIVMLITLLLAIVVPLQPALAAPSISVSPTYGAAGTTVTIVGDSFSSYAGDRITIFLDDTEISSGILTASTSSIFQIDIQIPDSTGAGTHLISVRNSSGPVIAESKFIVSAPEIILNQWGGTVGTTITASCKGFYAKRPVTIHYKFDDTTETLGTAITGNDGTCTFQFNIPASPEGNHLITAENAQGHLATVNFSVISSISINPDSGAVGDKVTVSGTGFETDSSIEVTLYGEKVAHAEVSESGSFDAIFNVPAIKAGIYALEITESSLSTRWLNFTVESKITLNKSTGAVGDKLTVAGTGFEADTAVSIKYDSQEITWLATDDTGAFSHSFEVPVSLAGPHVITVTDGFNTEQATFTMESEAPPAPKPLIPKLNTMVEAQVYFDWESVYDPSEPVVYTLQIARTSDFSKPIFEKTGLTSSLYTLTKEEALRPSRRWTHYYWRVRATDSASNIGDWSEPVAFQVSPTNTLPVLAKCAIGAAGVLLVILLVARIRKAIKPAVKKPQEP